MSLKVTTLRKGLSSNATNATTTSPASLIAKPTDGASPQDYLAAIEAQTAGEHIGVDLRGSDGVMLQWFGIGTGTLSGFLWGWMLCDDGGLMLSGRYTVTGTLGNAGVDGTLIDADNKVVDAYTLPSGTLLAVEQDPIVAGEAGMVMVAMPGCEYATVSGDDNAGDITSWNCLVGTYREIMENV
jgi:hypothetical protein